MPQENNYNTKKIIIVGIIILIIAGGIGYLIVRQKNKTIDQEQAKNLFPFDNGIATPSTPTGTPAPADIPNPIVSNPLSVASGERLRIVTNYPITGFYPSIYNKVTTEPKLDEATGKVTQVVSMTPTNMVRFNAKQNGFLADAEITKDSIVLEQKTSTSLPNASEIWFGNQGNTITYRSWNSETRTIDSFTGSIPVPTPPTYCTTVFEKILKKGDKLPEVKELQKYMNAKFGGNLTIDGNYGGKTLASVKKMQESLLVTATGIYDQPTIDALNADCNKIQADYQQQVQGIKKITGSFLTENISKGSVSPDGTQLFFLKPSPKGAVGVIARIDGTNQRQVFSSPLTEWRPQWINENTIALTTLASREADGYLYFLNLKTGDVRKILGPLRGLTTLVNPSGTKVLANTSTDTGMDLGIYSVITGDITLLDITTLPEKCTWANEGSVLCAVPQKIPDGQYPDDYYQGNVAFTDNLWFLDTEKNVNRLLLTPSQEFDAYHLKTSPDNTYLYFMNKLDNTLWSYRLSD